MRISLDVGAWDRLRARAAGEAWRGACDASYAEVFRPVPYSRQHAPDSAWMIIAMCPAQARTGPGRNG
jgi:hypothetical protein